MKTDKKFRLTFASKNAIAGYLFILPFIIGFLAFMARPMMQSLQMVFSEVIMDTEKRMFRLEYTGLSNLNKVFFIDSEFNRLLTEELGKMVLIVPAILIFSFFIAILLNQKFAGRGIARVIFFLPVILSSGIMIGLETNNSLLANMSELIQESNSVKSSITGVLERILIVDGGVASDFMTYIFAIVNQIHSIAMASGIQIVIFLSGLQAISPSIFEASRIEGATEWECFWKITFPMLSPLILVNVVYSVVDYFLRTDNNVMEKIRSSLLQSFEYGFASAMAWVYFLAVMVLLGIVCWVISRRVYYYE